MKLLRFIFIRHPDRHDSIAELALGGLCLLLGWIAVMFLPLVVGR